MATTRIKDLSKTATTLAADSNFVLDGSTNGTQKITTGNVKADIATSFAGDLSTYGIATLGSDNKLNPDQLPDSVTNGINFVGTADSGSDLTSTTQGDFYIVNTAFTHLSISYAVGDSAVYNGSAYVKVTPGTTQIGEGGTGASTLDGAKANLEIPDVGSAADEVSLNGMLGSMAFQSASSVAMAKAEIESTTGTATTQALTVTDGTDTNFVVQEDGKTGINTSSPDGAIHATGLSGSSYVIRAANQSGSDLGGIYTDGTGNGEFFLKDSAAAAKVVLNSSGPTYFTGGNVGIANTSPGSYNSNANNLVVGSGSGSEGLTIASGTTGEGGIYFADGTTGNQQYRGYLGYGHTNDELFFGVDGVTKWKLNTTGNLVPQSSGLGIDFGAVAGGSGTPATNGGLLADYEFGNFTVTAGGTWTVTPTSMGGRYVKVGNLVTCWVAFAGSPTKSSSLAGWLEGLPFSTNSYDGQGSVSDTGVTDRGVCYAANTNRLWLTNTSFGVTNIATVSYRHD
jgi:hypothetical protein